MFRIIYTNKMGLVSQMIGSFGQSVKSWVSSGIQYGRRGSDLLRKGLGKVNAFVDEILETAHNYPILADLATQLEESSYYQGYRDITQDLDDVLAQADRVFDDVEHYMGGRPHIEHDGFIDEFDRQLPREPGFGKRPTPPSLPGEGPRRPLPGLPA